MKLRVLVSFWCAELGHVTEAGQEITCSAHVGEDLIAAKMAEEIGKAAEPEKVKETQDESERGDAEPVVPAAKRKRGSTKRG